jgi:hypothetical protein
MLYHRSVEKNRDSRINSFILFVHNIWRRPVYQERVVRNQESLRLYAMIYINLLLCDAVDRSFCEIIQRVLDQGYATSVENVPFRAIDIRHMLDSVGFKHNLPSYDFLYQQTLLAKVPPILYLADLDVYTITHTLFYLSDFGFHSISAIPDEQIPTICWMAGSLLGLYLRQKNWDLVSELLLCCRCLRWPPPVVFDAAWKSLLDAQLPDGSIPGPHFSEEEMKKLDGLERSKYCFEKNYHTTLVSALTCFLSDQWLEDLRIMRG